MRDPTLLPLSILYTNSDEAVEGITRFQKLVFLAQEEILDQEQYEDFRPDDYGPFSVDLYDDIDWLCDEGLVDCETSITENGNDKQIYRLTDEGRELVEKMLRTSINNNEIPEEDLSHLNQQYCDMPLLQLLKRIYLEHPEMAKNSRLNLI